MKKGLQLLLLSSYLWISTISSTVSIIVYHQRAVPNFAHVCSCGCNGNILKCSCNKNVGIPTYSGCTPSKASIHDVDGLSLIIQVSSNELFSPELAISSHRLPPDDETLDGVKKTVEHPPR